MAGAVTDSPTNKRSLVTETDKTGGKRIPVTLLSGFLGSGKTTLLQHILKNKDHALRVAVIVNDMGELNIDADLVASADVLQREEQLVRLENGCICCTLRVDLLEQIARIAQQVEVDYIVIESSGISEPMQVAETFVFELPEGAEEEAAAMKADPALSPGSSKRSRTESGASSGNDTSAASSSPTAPAGIPTIQFDELLVRDGEKLPLLRDIALLDTCVTVVDSATFFHVFDDPRMLADVEENRSQLSEGDTRTITDLLIDQIEFADIILLNKTDLVPAKDVEVIEKVLRRLNSYAKIERTVKGRVDSKMILGTKLFSFERASQQTGWFESLTVPHTPETVEYGIGSFLYKASRPFHPARLTGMIQDEFVIVESPTLPPFPSDDDDGHDHDHEEEEEEEADGDQEIETEEDGEPLGQQEIAKRLEGKQNGLFKNLLRSKGVFWLGTRPHNYATWSQAGLYCTLANGGMWIAAIPEEDRTRTMKELPNYKELMARIYGDRGQELVFIGRFSQEDDEIANIRAALDSCLLTDEEMKQYKASDFEEWEDPFEPWEYYSFEDYSCSTNR